MLAVEWHSEPMQTTTTTPAEFAADQDLRWSSWLAEMNVTRPYVVVYFDDAGRKWAHECTARSPLEAEQDCWDNERHVSSISEVIEK